MYVIYIIIIINNNNKPIPVVNKGLKNPGLNIFRSIANTSGINIRTYIIILELLVSEVNSSLNFFLLNKVFSIESNTLIIFHLFYLILIN